MSWKSPVPLFALAIIAAVGVTEAQPNRGVPIRRCYANFDTSSCFRDLSSEYQVGRRVDYLGNLYKFCFDLDTINLTKKKPARVVLAIDYSSSMCRTTATDTANDPSDMRVLASHLFLDSLASRSFHSQVGVIKFFADATNFGPLPLDAPAKITAIHQEIERAACSSPTGYPIGKVRKATETNIGQALRWSLWLADRDYSTIETTHTRHIILLTDGEWDDLATVSPQKIWDDYHRDYPGRPMPTIHTVFLTHPSNTNSELTALKQISDMTGGQHFGNVPPDSIVALFQRILGDIVELQAQTLTQISFFKPSTGERSAGKITPLSTTEFAVSMPNLPLEFGLNEFVIEQTLDTKSGEQTVRDTLRITKLDQDINESQISGITVTCRLDTVLMGIEATPGQVTEGQSIAMTATIPATDTVKRDLFLRDLSGVTLRAIGEFPDDDQTASYVRVYHLEGVLTEARGRGTGSGSPAYSTRGAFGRGIESGSFTVEIPPLELASDFTLEAWILPAASGEYTIFSGPLTLKVTAAGQLQLTFGGATWVTNGSLDRGVWQHVAVSRKSGTANMYVNGIPVAAAQNVGTSVNGTLTIGSSTGGSVDEVRITNVSQTRTIQAGVVGLELPAATGISWNTGSLVQGAEVVVGPGKWSSLNSLDLNFQITSAGGQDVIVNLLHSSPDEKTLTWSKTSDPIRFSPEDTIGPKIQRAIYYPGRGINDPPTGQYQDTLIVIYSEKVKCFTATSGTDILDYTDADGSLNPLTGSRLTRTSCNMEYVTEDTLILAVGAAQVEPEEDAVRFRDSAVVDMHGNPARGSVDSTVIEWGVDDAEPPQVTANPADASARIPPELRQNMTELGGAPVSTDKIPETGVVIISKSLQPLEAGHVTIYDAVGNTVQKRTAMYRRTTDNHLYFHWGAKNRNGRTVGGGTYLVVIETSKKDGETDLSQIKLGIKR